MLALDVLIIELKNLRKTGHFALLLHSLKYSLYILTFFLPNFLTLKQLDPPLFLKFIYPYICIFYK